MDRFPITPRQRDTLSVISQMTKRKGGIGPTYQELAAEMGISYQAAMQIAERLMSRGKLRRVPSSARTLQVVKEGASA